jgi:hypothetical protein
MTVILSIKLEYAKKIFKGEILGDYRDGQLVRCKNAKK